MRRDSRRPVLPKVGYGELSPSPVTNVKHFCHFLFLQNVEHHSIDVRLATEEKLSERILFSSRRTAKRQFFQAENCLSDASFSSVSSLW
jgi:hypothetical protein